LGGRAYYRFPWLVQAGNRGAAGLGDTNNLRDCGGLPDGPSWRRIRYDASRQRGFDAAEHLKPPPAQSAASKAICYPPYLYRGAPSPTEPRSPIRRWERDACSCRCTSKIQRRVVDNFFHHEKRSGLPDTGQRDEFLAVQTVEIGHVTDPDLEEIVEISRNQMAIEHESQAANGGLELGKALGRRAVEHDADHDKGSAIDLLRRDLGPHAGDIAFGEQALGTPVTGGGADIHPLRELGVTETAIAVQEAENFLVDPV